MAGSGALERLRAANQRAVIGLLAGEGPMSRADLVRGQRAVAYDGVEPGRAS